MKNKSVYKLCRCGFFAAIVCVCSFICIPIGVVPVTAALLAIMLCGIVLTPVEAVSVSLVYIIIGAIGLPVFSGGGAGVGILIGPTGGYIWSYPILALIISLFGYISAKTSFKKCLFLAIGCLIGIIICYFCGTIQYMLVTKASLNTALISCVLPFAVFDIAKSAVAISIGIPLKNKIKI